MGRFASKECVTPEEKEDKLAMYLFAGPTSYDTDHHENMDHECVFGGLA